MLREGAGNDIFSHYGLNNYNRFYDHVRGSTYRNDNRGDPNGR